jgi:RNA 2',3'-cyclic 3'-phosphodiesterase
MHRLPMRTFIAIELPVAVQHHVLTVQQRLQAHLAQVDSRPGFNWTPPANTHLTLRFLGETDEQQRSALIQGLASLCAQHNQFSLRLEGVGCFPNFRAPRIIWQGIHGDLPQLVALHAPVEALARAVGFAAEERSFSPHLTLARARRDAGRPVLTAAGRALEQLASSAAQLPAVTFVVTEVHLMRSELLRGGARYRSLGSFPLGG